MEYNEGDVEQRPGPGRSALHTHLFEQVAYSAADRTRRACAGSALLASPGSRPGTDNHQGG